MMGWLLEAWQMKDSKALSISLVSVAVEYQQHPQSCQLQTTHHPNPSLPSTPRHNTKQLCQFSLGTSTRSWIRRIHHNWSQLDSLHWPLTFPSLSRCILPERYPTDQGRMCERCQKRGGRGCIHWSQRGAKDGDDHSIAMWHLLQIHGWGGGWILLGLVIWVPKNGWRNLIHGLWWIGDQQLWSRSGSTSHGKTWSWSWSNLETKTSASMGSGVKNWMNGIRQLSCGCSGDNSH